MIDWGLLGLALGLIFAGINAYCWHKVDPKAEWLLDDCCCSKEK